MSILGEPVTSAIHTAVSGLMAQSVRLSVSADNVANMRSVGLDPNASAAAGVAASTTGHPPFIPLSTLNVSQAGGGVKAVLVPNSPPSVALFDPNNPAADAQGLVHLPNVSLEEELVTQMLARRVFQANVEVIKAQDEMLGSLLDLTS